MAEQEGQNVKQVIRVVRRKASGIHTTSDPKYATSSPLDHTVAEASEVTTSPNAVQMSLPDNSVKEPVFHETNIPYDPENDADLAKIPDLGEPEGYSLSESIVEPISDPKPVSASMPETKVVSASTPSPVFISETIASSTQPSISGIEPQQAMPLSGSDEITPLPSQDSINKTIKEPADSVSVNVSAVPVSDEITPLPSQDSINKTIKEPADSVSVNVSAVPAPDEITPLPSQDSINKTIKEPADGTNVNTTAVPMAAQTLPPVSEPEQMPKSVITPTPVPPQNFAPAPAAESKPNPTPEPIPQSPRQVTSNKIQPVDGSVSDAASAPSGSQRPGTDITPIHKAPMVKSPKLSFAPPPVITEFKDTSDTTSDYVSDLPHEFTQVPRKHNFGAIPVQTEPDYEDDNSTSTSNEPSPFALSMDDNFAERLNLPKKVLSTKFMAMLCTGIFLIGLLMGIFLFGSSSETTPKNTMFTIGYIVQNPEVPSGRSRCGSTEMSQGCTLYVQNNKTRELQAKDFYPLVMQLTGLQRFQIETGNMRYAHKVIRPGWIAQFNIPPSTK